MSIWSGHSWGILSGGSSEFTGAVAIYSDLPPASSVTNEIYRVLNNQGVYGFRKLKGFYFSDGATWTYQGYDRAKESIRARLLQNPDTHILTDARLADLNANTTARHTHVNLPLLETYTQTEVDLADAVVKKHTHANKPLLDGITEPPVGEVGHEALDYLGHGIVENCFKQYTFTMGQLTKVTIWTDNTPSQLKIRETEWAFTAGLLSSSVKRQYDAIGNLKINGTYTKTYTYINEEIDNIIGVRS